MSRFIDITGQRYGRWTAIRFIGVKNRKMMYECVCDCGGTGIVSSNALRMGRSQSCGCLMRERTSKANSKHGGYKSPEYHIWLRLRRRCNDIKDKRYGDYGGRGIKVCDRWLDSFENFITDMGPRPSPSYSIDRIDNSGSYCPENCRWATQREQSRNRRSNTYIHAFGRAYIVSEWAEITGIKRATISDRIKRGWNPEAALSFPVCLGESQRNIDNMIHKFEFELEE